jgi:hypothetical protein
VSEEAGFAGLLDEIRDAVLVGDGEGDEIVRVAGVECEGLAELGLGGGKFSAREEARSCEIGVIGGEVLTLGVLIWRGWRGCSLRLGGSV